MHSSFYCVLALLASAGSVAGNGQCMDRSSCGWDWPVAKDWTVARPVPTSEHVRRSALAKLLGK